MPEHATNSFAQNKIPEKIQEPKKPALFGRLSLIFCQLRQPLVP
jgi:hypothetical protein